MAYLLLVVSTLIACSKCSIPTQEDFNTLNSNLQCGFVVTPADESFTEYAASSVSTFDSINIPSAVVMSACEQDIITTMKWLEKYMDVSFTIRSGGHSFGGYSKANDAILIDLSQMNDINIVDDNKMAIEPGLKHAAFETWKVNNPQFPYTFPHGLSPYPAIGGFATGGGIGLTTRQLGVTSDYIYGVRVVLCDGSLYEIFENDNKNTKCLQRCDESSELDDEELRQLLYAIKGAGGGNFGIITKYYFNTIPDPEFPMYFQLVYDVTNRDTIFNSFISFRNIMLSDFEDNNNFALLQITTINPQPPFNLIVIFFGIYLSETNDETIFNEIIAKIEEYMQSPPSIPFTDTDTTLTEIYTNYLFPILSNSDYRGYFSSRLIYTDTLSDTNDIYFNAVSDYLYQNIPALFSNGVVLTSIIESLGGAIAGNNIINKQTSFPVQNRQALASMESSFLAPMLPGETPETVTGRLNLAKLSRDTFDQQIQVLAGIKKYINYIDDINNDLTVYYSKNEIEKLSDIQEEVDPNGCFALIDVDDDASDESESVSDSVDTMSNAFDGDLKTDDAIKSSRTEEYHWTIDLSKSMLLTVALMVMTSFFGIVVCCSNYFRV